jgi:hypothetical protein
MAKLAFRNGGCGGSAPAAVCNEFGKLSFDALDQLVAALHDFTRILAG